jgi:predicted small lipoprotein YifL
MPYNSGMSLRFLLGAVAAVLVGCGYKGPLYLPTAKAEAPRPSTVVTPDPQRPLPAEAAPAPK